MTRHRLSRLWIWILFLAMSAAALPARAQTPTTLPEAEKDAVAPRTDPKKMADQIMALVENNELPAAMELFTQLRRIAPNTDRLHLAAARLMAADQKFDQAQLFYQQYTTTAEGKNDYRPFAELGRLYLRSKSYRQARRNLEQAQQLAPERDADGKHYIRAEIMADLANVHRILRDNKEAVKVGREAATQAIGDPKIQVMFGQLLVTISQEETKEPREVAARAIAKLNDELAADPFNENNLRLLKDALSVVAATWASDVMAQKDNPEAVYMLSIASQDVAEISKRISLIGAREYALRAITLNENKPEYRIRAAEIEFEFGAKSNAQYRLSDVFKIDPDNTAAKALNERMEAFPPRKIGVAAGL